MNARLVVAVTGVGGGVGLSVLRALEAEQRPVTLVGLDMNPDSLGLLRCDRSFVIPAAHDPSYVDCLLDACVRGSVDVLIPGSDPELLPQALAKDRFAEAGVNVLISGPDAVRIACSKLATARFLIDRDLPFARTVPVARALDLAKQVGFPLIVKPDSGSGSRDVHVVLGPHELTRYLNHQELVAQEYASAARWGIQRSMLEFEDLHRSVEIRQEDEISIQLVFDQHGGEMGSFTSRNHLKNGSPMLIEPEEHADALAAARRVAREFLDLGMIGPCNLQGRLTEDGIVFFEINARFTGITAIRTMMGFREVEAVLRSLHFGESASSARQALRQPGELVGLRYLEDHVASRTLLEQLRHTGQLHREEAETGR